MPAGFLAILLAGCSIHPLPEDVAPLNTVEIVEHIRCEMYDALRHQVVLAFELSGAHEVAKEIEASPERPLQDFSHHIKRLNEKYGDRVEDFRRTTIGYGFRFNITEQDVAKSEFNFGLPWNNVSNFTLKAAAGLDKKRSNTRRFYKVDSFEELLFSKDCLTTELNAANLIYPITGTIGLKNTVDDFIKLTTRGARSESTKDVQNFSEQLTFTTEISGSINPKVKLAPLTDIFRLADASGEVNSKRTDVHELTITFAIDTGRKPAAYGYAPLAGVTAGQQGVIQELNQLRLIDALERSGRSDTP